MTLLDAEHVPCAPVLTRSKLIEHPQIRDSGILVESDHPEAGRLRQSRAAARFEGTPTKIRHGAPKLGQHSEDILAEAGLDDEEIAALRAAGGLGDE
jgi:crotonobetainyl-CoA:carnitine CoA-transferase CaiB-like acyl-CoA transferase